MVLLLAHLALLGFCALSTTLAMATYLWWSRHRVTTLGSSSAARDHELNAIKLALLLSHQETNAASTNQQADVSPTDNQPVNVGPVITSSSLMETRNHV